MPNDRLVGIDGRGAHELHVALAAYLDRVRGTAADPDHFVMSIGFAQAALLAGVLRARGMRRIAVEDPSDDTSVHLARGAGLEVIGIPVDESGIDVAALARTARMRSW